ncbi:MAG TPA: hypothetical protein VFU22_07450 [Roseiflexaceae bacterium]|nr:hypothetical protein [Roseiflexaceae bacterium]
MSRLTDAGDARWFRFLSRWSLVAGLMALALFLAFSIAILPASQNSSLPAEYSELVAATHSPTLYRLAITLDVAVWLGLGGFFLALAAIFARRAPIRAMFLLACGLGMVVGVVGAYARLVGTTDLAARYVTAPAAEQASLLRSYLDLRLTIGANFGAGALLWSTALLLAASVAWSMAEFPRWLAVGLGLPGIIMLPKQVLELVTGVDLGAFFFPAFILLIVVLFAMAGVFWRRAPLGAPNVSSVAAS